MPRDHSGGGRWVIYQFSLQQDALHAAIGQLLWFVFGFEKNAKFSNLLRHPEQQPCCPFCGHLVCVVRRAPLSSGYFPLEIAIRDPSIRATCDPQMKCRLWFGSCLILKLEIRMQDERVLPVIQHPKNRPKRFLQIDRLFFIPGRSASLQSSLDKKLQQSRSIHVNGSGVRCVQSVPFTGWTSTSSSRRKSSLLSEHLSSRVEYSLVPDSVPGIQPAHSPSTIKCILAFKLCSKLSLLP